MRGIIIFSHDFIHASIIIVIMMILVIRWRNIFFLLVLVHSDPQHERNKKIRKEFMLITILFMTFKAPSSKWIPLSNLHQDPSMNSIPQSFLHKRKTAAHHDGFEREENLLSDGTAYNCRGAPTLAGVGFTRLENSFRFSVYPASSSGTSRPFKQHIATLRHTLEYRLQVCWLRCACVGSHRLLLNNFTRRSFRANVYSVANSNQRCSGKKRLWENSWEI